MPRAQAQVRPCALPCRYEETGFWEPGKYKTALKRVENGSQACDTLCKMLLERVRKPNGDARAPCLLVYLVDDAASAGSRQVRCGTKPGPGKVWPCARVSLCVCVCVCVCMIVRRGVCA